MDVELAGGPKKQRAVLLKSKAHPDFPGRSPSLEILSPLCVCWRQFTAVSKTARKSSGFLS